MVATDVLIIAGLAGGKPTVLTVDIALSDSRCLTHPKEKAACRSLGRALVFAD
jgi:hypothetical protein